VAAVELGDVDELALEDVPEQADTASAVTVRRIPTPILQEVSGRRRSGVPSKGLTGAG
jgi:hypothetical protein